MKHLSNLIKYTAVLLFSSMSTLAALAQDSQSNLDIDFEPTAIDSGPFYAQLWFWIVIGMVFLLLLIALIRGNGGKPKIEKEEDKDEEDEE